MFLYYLIPYNLINIISAILIIVHGLIVLSILFTTTKIVLKTFYRVTATTFFSFSIFHKILWFK